MSTVWCWFCVFFAMSIYSGLGFCSLYLPFFLSYLSNCPALYSLFFRLLSFSLLELFSLTLVRSPSPPSLSLSPSPLSLTLTLSHHHFVWLFQYICLLFCHFCCYISAMLQGLFPNENIRVSNSKNLCGVRFHFEIFLCSWFCVPFIFISMAVEFFFITYISYWHILWYNVLVNVNGFAMVWYCVQPQLYGDDNGKSIQKATPTTLAKYENLNPTTNNIRQ